MHELELTSFSTFGKSSHFSPTLQHRSSLLRVTLLSGKGLPKDAILLQLPCGLFTLQADACDPGVN